jgi:fibronectin type 3 domain-containing protein
VGQPVTGTEFVDSGYAGAGLVPGGHYALRVSAVDRSYNESAPVQADATIPDDDPPAAPTGFHARNAAGRWVALDWSASPALDVRRYALTRAESGSAPVEVGQYAADAAAGARDTAALHGHRYVYRLEAVDSAGNRGPAAEDTLDFRDLVAPPAPRATAARLTPRGIEVSWERVVEGELAGYNVYRAALPTGAFVRVTSSPVTAQRFVDPGGRPELYYVVRAVDRSANESKPSPAARAAGQR